MDEHTDEITDQSSPNTQENQEEIELTPDMEIVEERTEYAKVYDIGNNQRKMVVSYFPVHIKDKNGKWIDIACKIRGRKITKAPYEARLLKNKIGYQMKAPDGKLIEIELIDVKIPKPTIINNAAVWENVTPGVDITIAFTSRTVMFYRTLKNKKCKKEFKFRILKEKDLTGSIIFIGQDSEGKKLELEQKQKSKKEIKKRGKTYEEEIVSDKFTGRVTIMDPKTRKRSWSEDVKYPVMIS